MWELFVEHFNNYFITLKKRYVTFMVNSQCRHEIFLNFSMSVEELLVVHPSLLWFQHLLSDETLFLGSSVRSGEETAGEEARL